MGGKRMTELIEEREMEEKVKTVRYNKIGSSANYLSRDEGAASSTTVVDPNTGEQKMLLQKGNMSVDGSLAQKHQLNRDREREKLKLSQSHRAIQHQIEAPGGYSEPQYRSPKTTPLDHNN